MPHEFVAKSYLAKCKGGCGATSRRPKRMRNRAAYFCWGCAPRRPRPRARQSVGNDVDLVRTLVPPRPGDGAGVDPWLSLPETLTEKCRHCRGTGSAIEQEGRVVCELCGGRGYLAETKAEKLMRLIAERKAQSVAEVSGHGTTP